jgi:hypothetical protein
VAGFRKSRRSESFVLIRLDTIEQEITEFRTKLQSFAERLQRVRGHINNEEQTKVTLILLFISMLGYDDRDPTEVSAEHAADFSEKYKNRFDYAILRDMKPIVAVERKSAGGSRKDDRRQLKAYFNSAKTVKLGVLTDGILYGFFVDSVELDKMDDDPFLPNAAIRRPCASDDHPVPRLSSSSTR